MKGLSPLIAALLLIGFTVAVGGLISVWIGGLASTQTESITGSTDKLLKCSKSVLDVTQVQGKTFSRPTGSNWGEFNVTLQYITGTEDIYNFTISLTDSSGNVVQNNTVSNNIYYTNGTTTVAFLPGSKAVLNLKFNANISTSPVSKVFVAAKCQSDYTVSFEDTIFD